MQKKKQKDFKDKDKRSQVYGKGKSDAYISRRGKRSSKQFNSEEDTPSSSSTSKGQQVVTNDPSFYSDSVLKSNAANLFFDTPTGAMPTLGYKSSRDDFQNIYNPNVIAIEVLPVFGQFYGYYGSNAVDQHLFKMDAMNTVAKKLRWKLTNKSGRNTLYESGDILALFMRYYNMLFQIWQARRIYGVVKEWYIKNPHFARNVCEASCYDYDNISTNLADFRYSINRAIECVNQYAMPDLFYIRNHYQSMFDNIYCDSQVYDSAQFYVFHTADKYWRCNDKDGTFHYIPDTGSSVSSGTTVSAWTSRINTLITDFVHSDDMEAIMTDIMRVFSDKTAYMSIEYLSDPYHVTPVCNTNVLLELHNATIYSTSQMFKVSAQSSFYAGIIHPRFFGGIIKLDETYTDMYTSCVGIFNTVSTSYTTTGKDIANFSAGSSCVISGLEGSWFRAPTVFDIPRTLEPLPEYIMEYTMFNCSSSQYTQIDYKYYSYDETDSTTYETDIYGLRFQNFRDAIIVNVVCIGNSSTGKSSYCTIPPAIPQNMGLNTTYIPRLLAANASLYTPFKLELATVGSGTLPLTSASTGIDPLICSGWISGGATMLDLDKYIFISKDQLNKIHYAATNALWSTDSKSLLVFK